RRLQIVAARGLRRLLAALARRDCQARTRAVVLDLALGLADADDDCVLGTWLLAADHERNADHFRKPEPRYGQIRPLDCYREFAGDIVPFGGAGLRREHLGGDCGNRVAELLPVELAGGVAEATCRNADGARKIDAAA